MIPDWLTELNKLAQATASSGALERRVAELELQERAGALAHDLIALAKLGCTAPRWVPVGEKPPEQGSEVLGWHEVFGGIVVSVNGDKWAADDCYEYPKEKFTHWQAIVPPESEGG